MVDISRRGASGPRRRQFEVPEVNTIIDNI
jgi:hypothetical protein